MGAIVLEIGAGSPFIESFQLSKDIPPIEFAELGSTDVSPPYTREKREEDEQDEKKKRYLKSLPSSSYH